ncbi:MAG: hypothetical protein ACRCX2_28505 [Paraclostridium sp.]
MDNVKFNHLRVAINSDSKKLKESIKDGSIMALSRDRYILSAIDNLRQLEKGYNDVHDHIGILTGKLSKVFKIEKRYLFYTIFRNKSVDLVLRDSSRRLELCIAMDLVYDFIMKNNMMDKIVVILDAEEMVKKSIAFSELIKWTGDYIQD